MSRAPRRRPVPASEPAAAHPDLHGREAQVAALTCLRAVADGTPACCAVAGLAPDHVATLAVYAVGLLRGVVTLRSFLTPEQHTLIAEAKTALAAEEQATVTETDEETLAAVRAFLDGQLETHALEELFEG